MDNSWNLIAQCFQFHRICVRKLDSFSERNGEVLLGDSGDSNVLAKILDNSIFMAKTFDNVEVSRSLRYFLCL